MTIKIIFEDGEIRVQSGVTAYRFYNGTVTYKYLTVETGNGINYERFSGVRRVIDNSGTGI